VFDVPIHHMTKLLFGLLVFGSQYHHTTFGRLIVFVAAKSAIIYESIGILAIDFDVVHIVAFGTELHFAIYYDITLCLFPFQFFSYKKHPIDETHGVSSICNFLDIIHPSRRDGGLSGGRPK
jgi:hypothetical protein